MKFIAFLIVVFAIGYGFYWTFLSQGFGLLKPYLGYNGYSELRRNAWFWFTITFAVFAWGVTLAVSETQLYRFSFMPCLAAGYLAGHLHFICIPRARWQR